MAQLGSDLVILTMMYELDIPLQPKSIYGALINKQDITFSYRTVQNKVGELVESGDLKKVSIDMDRGDIEDIPENDNSRRAHYLITDQGRDRVETEVLD